MHRQRLATLLLASGFLAAAGCAREPEVRTAVAPPPAAADPAKAPAPETPTGPSGSVPAGIAEGGCYQPGPAQGPAEPAEPGAKPAPPLDPPVAETPRPDQPVLSPAGRLAYGILQHADEFTSDAVGEGGEVPLQVEALRALFREKEADAAFKRLLENASLPGRIFALCGVWYTDPKGFAEAEAALLEESGDEEVGTFFGCCKGRQSLRSLVKYEGKAVVVRLKDRKQTIREWSLSRPKDEDREYDVEGGAYPCIFRRGWERE